MHRGAGGLGCAGAARTTELTLSFFKLTLYFLTFSVVAPAGGGRHRRDIYHSIGNLTGYPAVYVACRASLMWAQTYPRLFRVFGRGGRHGCPVQTGYIPFDRKSYGLSNDIYNLGCAAAWRLLGGVRTSELTLSFLQLTLSFFATYPILFDLFHHSARHNGCTQTIPIPFDRESKGLPNGI